MTRHLPNRNPQQFQQIYIELDAYISSTIIFAFDFSNPCVHTVYYCIVHFKTIMPGLYFVNYVNNYKD